MVTWQAKKEQVDKLAMQYKLNYFIQQKTVFEHFRCEVDPKCSIPGVDALTDRGNGRGRRRFQG